MIGPAWLGGYRLSFHKRSLVDGSGKCTVVQTSGGTDRVYGVLYQLGAADRERLDEQEIVLGQYTRIAVDTRHLGNGRSHEAWTYQAPQYLTDPGLQPYDWYLALVVRGAQHHGLPAEYIGWLSSVRSRTDTDAARRRPFDQLLAQL